MNTLRIGNIEAKLPIIQGGMGIRISLAGLAAAVANAGGIGIISAAGIGMTEPDYMKKFREANIRALRKEIQKARSLTDGLIGLNVMIALSDHEDLIKTAVEEKIDLIIMGAGLPMKIPAMIEEAGLSGHNTKFAIKVSSAKAAKIIFQSWANKYNIIPDAVVVEGPLAGGHLGFKANEVTGDVVPLDKLIRETVAEVKVFEELFNREIPVIAAGGIYTGKDIFDIMQAGAKGVKLGTRFVATHECDADIAFKQSYINCTNDDITIIKSPVGMPGRVVKNEFVEQILLGNTKPFKCPWNCITPCNYKEAPYCISKVLLNASQGNMTEGFAFAGANAYRTDKIVHVSELVDELVTEYEAAAIHNQLLVEENKLTSVC